MTNGQSPVGDWSATMVKKWKMAAVRHARDDVSQWVSNQFLILDHFILNQMLRWWLWAFLTCCQWLDPVKKNRLPASQSSYFWLNHRHIPQVSSGSSLRFSEERPDLGPYCFTNFSVWYVGGSYFEFCYPRKNVILIWARNLLEM